LPKPPSALRTSRRARLPALNKQNEYLTAQRTGNLGGSPRKGDRRGAPSASRSPRSPSRAASAVRGRLGQAWHGRCALGDASGAPPPRPWAAPRRLISPTQREIEAVGERGATAMGITESTCL